MSSAAYFGNTGRQPVKESTVSNPIVVAGDYALNVLKKIGGVVETGVKDVDTAIADLPKYIAVATDVATEAPQVVTETQAVITAIAGGSTLFSSIIAALAGMGTNITADAAVLTNLIADAPKAADYWSNVKTAFEALLTTLGTDKAQIEALFNTPAPAGEAGAGATQ